jgi:dihydroorotate dehydrogenase electron transfer subunit
MLISITTKETIAPAWWQLTLTAAELGARLAPGQFLLVRCANCYLRRPIFPGPIGPDTASLLLRPTTDPGLAWLASRQPGETLDVLGPFGCGYPLGREVRHLLLVSDSMGLSPLLGHMQRATAGGVAVTLALGGSRAETIYPLEKIPAAVEFYAATQDGSQGQRGPITALLPELLGWADLVCAAGSPRLYRTLRTQTDTIRLGIPPGFLFGLIDSVAMPCGTGACYGCAIPTGNTSQRVCVDGPVFDLAIAGVNHD